MSTPTMTVAVGPVNRWAARIRSSPLGLRLARGAFWSTASAVAGRLVTLVSTVFLARSLGKSQYGELGVIQSSMMMFAIFAGAGLGATCAKYVAEYRETDSNRAGRIMALS